MKRSLLLTLMAITGTAILAVALVGFRLSQGGLDYSAFAHIIDYDGNTTNDFHVEIDADSTNGTGPCNPVDVVANVAPGTHQVAICVGSPADKVSAFSAVLDYNAALNSCPDEECAVSGGTNCVDDNPDANVGATLGSGVPTTPNLGTGWDCSGFGFTEPACNVDIDGDTVLDGAAKIDCLSSVGPYTSPIGDLSFPLAVVTFDVIAEGIDTMDLSVVVLGGVAAAGEIGSCNPLIAIEMPCYGITDLKNITQTPTPTQTPTATSTQTATHTAVGCRNTADCAAVTPMSECYPTPG